MLVGTQRVAATCVQRNPLLYDRKQERVSHFLTNLDQLRQYRRWPSGGPVCTPGAPPCCQRRDACLWPDWLTDGGTGTKARVRSDGRGLTPRGKLRAFPASSCLNCDTSYRQLLRV